MNGTAVAERENQVLVQTKTVGDRPYGRIWNRPTGKWSREADLDCYVKLGYWEPASEGTKQEIEALREGVTKGDYPGHPFRGNQWTEGYALPEEEEIDEGEHNAPLGFMRVLTEGVSPSLSNIDATSVALKEHVEKTLQERMKANPKYEDYQTFLRATGMATPDKLSPEAHLIHSWANTSMDSSWVAVVMQRAAQQEFGLPEETMSHANAATMAQVERLEKKNPAAMAGARAFMREMYNSTQEFLKKNNIKEMTVFRGFILDKNASPVVSGVAGDKFTLQPLSSFSADLGTAVDFSNLDVYETRPKHGYVVAVKVPAERILATPRTGFGCYGEVEVVVLGGKDIKMVSYRHDMDIEVESHMVASRLRDSVRRLRTEGRKAETQSYNLDADPENQDWIKTAWDLPPYESREFSALVPDLVAFRRLPIYRFAVRQGKIVGDRWVGKVSKGDVEGHPFRGNQYTDVAGTGKEEEAPKEPSPISDKTVESWGLGFYTGAQDTAERDIREGRADQNEIVQGIRQGTYKGHIYRGMYLDKEDEYSQQVLSWKRGDEVQIMPCSFSKDKSTAEFFTQNMAGLPGDIPARAVLIEVRPLGDKVNCADIGDRVPEEFRYQREVISGGRMWVAAVKDMKKYRHIIVVQTGVF